jgi:hypothetical protein
LKLVILIEGENKRITFEAISTFRNIRLRFTLNALNIVKRCFLV